MLHKKGTMNTEETTQTSFEETIIKISKRSQLVNFLMKSPLTWVELIIKTRRSIETKAWQ